MKFSKFGVFTCSYVYSVIDLKKADNNNIFQSSVLKIFMKAHDKHLKCQSELRRMSSKLANCTFHPLVACDLLILL